MKHLVLSKLIALLVVSLFAMSLIPQLGLADLASSGEDPWVAYPMHISQFADPLTSPQGYSPSQIKTAYGLPQTGGAGATIAIIDAYNTPSILADLTTFSGKFNLPLPTDSNFEIHNMSVSMSTKAGWGEETCLDVEWAHAIAPEAKILLVEATDNSNGLLSALDYARSRSDVVSISMSWGGPEASWNTNYDSRFTSIYGAAFFASAGDNGEQVNWPANAQNVVAVGGTTLNLNFTDGTLISETAWSGSGGGVSDYEPVPSYQTSYGLNASNREVPDVSYNANPTTGVAVCYNSGWYVIGGTSAGAPQWAAIHALGRSATNVNIYGKAKLAYSSYFRDITSGSNGNPTYVGYDLVTGLGSPLTDNFNSTFTFSPTSGPAGGLIAFNGTGFTPNNFVNISYLNPFNSSWVPLANNVPTTAMQNFTSNVTAPDLLQNNTIDDNQPLFDSIVFRAHDGGTGMSYNSITSYSEWRRGLTQIGNNTATGLYGNGTNRSATVFVQSNQSMIVAGEWFSPGNVSLLWDGAISLGTTSTDGNGFFNVTVQVPTTSAGQHTLTINDEISNFSVNITRLPTITDDYTNTGWHISNLTINLTPDYNVTQIYYKINNGAIENVTANGQPVIASEGVNNTLEYWSTWDVYGTGNMELDHVLITGIQFETTPPSSSMVINNGETSTSESLVTLSVNATNSLSGISQIRFNNDGVWDNISWQPYTNSVSWTLTSGEGFKTIYCQIKDNAGLITPFSSSITFSNPPPPPTPTPTPTPAPPTLTPTTTASPTPSPSPTATLSSSPDQIDMPSQTPSVMPEAPESSIQMILVLIALLTFSFVVKYKRKLQNKID